MPIAGILVLPHIVADLACAGGETIVLRAQLISATLVYAGIVTICQTTFGLRLAVLNGPAFAFIPPLYAFSRQHADFVCRAAPTDAVPRELYYGKLQLVSTTIVASGDKTAHRLEDLRLTCRRRRRAVCTRGDGGRRLHRASRRPADDLRAYDFVVGKWREGLLDCAPSTGTLADWQLRSCA